MTRRKRYIDFRILLLQATIPSFLVFALIATFIYLGERQKIVERNENLIKKDLSILNSLYESDVYNNKQQNHNALLTFKNIILSTGEIHIENKSEKVEAINIVTHSVSKEKVNFVIYNGDTLNTKQTIFKNLSLSLGSDLLFAEKSKSGYVVINSTSQEFNNILIPLSIELTNKINDEEEFNGEINILGKDYLVSASPFYYKGSISGILLAIRTKTISYITRSTFLSKQYLKRGYAFAMSPEGILTIHPNKEGASIRNTQIYRKIIGNAMGITPVRIEYVWPENENGFKKIMFVSFNPAVDSYVGITYYPKDYSFALRKLFIRLLISILLSVAIYTWAFYTVVFRQLRTIRRMRKVINELKSGNYRNIDRISENKYEKALQENFIKLEEFTESLLLKNYNLKYEKWGKNDKISENLLLIRDKLKEEYEKTQSELSKQEKLLWLNEGLSKFIEILKYQVIEIKDLAYKIISQIVEYVGASEGGFFIVTMEGDGSKYLELLVAYASHREKILQRKIPFGSGLLGRVAIEKKTLFITEIPDSYYKISTALGTSKPKSIIFLPLIFNEEVIGIIELASLKIFTELELEFLERISENISANLAMWRASQQTAKLLRETREQARKMERQQKDLEKHIQELNKLREESEKREIELNSIIKAVDTSALLVEFDTNGYITSVNNRFLTTLGKREDEIIGKHHSEITTMKPESKEYKDFWKDLLDGKSKRFIESFVIQDKTVWLSQNYVPILDKNGKVFKVLNIAIDITENKLLEKQLRSQVKEISKEARLVRKEQRKVRKEREEFINKENGYLTALKALDKYVAHVEFTNEGKITYVNEIFAENLGYKNADFLIGKNIKDLVNVKELEKFKMAIDSVIKNKEFEGKINFYNTDSEPVSFDIYMLAAFDTKNNPLKIIMSLIKN